MDAAEMIGTVPITLMRWVLDHGVVDCGYERDGWRVFLPSGMREISAYAHRNIFPGGAE